MIDEQGRDQGDEAVLREKAREVVQAGTLPNRRPDRTWGGSGIGADCTICGTPVKHDERIMNQARCRAIDRVRFEHRKKRVHNHAATPAQASAANGPHEALEVSEQGDLLRHALQVLTPVERQVIETAFFSELTYAEVAEKLNQPLGSVKTRIRSGLAKLRQALAGRVQGP